MEVTKTKILAYQRKWENLGFSPFLSNWKTWLSSARFRSKLDRNYSQKYGNQNQSRSNLGCSAQRPKIKIHFNPLSNLNANNKNNIARSKDRVKTSIFSKVKTKENPGEIKTWPSQPAERLPQIPERTLNKDFLSFLESSITFNLSRERIFCQ